MVDVLNLALKKEIFEGLRNGITNEIPIEKTNWWKKRLMDVDTGRFKPFQQVIATCGSADKYLYDIEKIELVDETFIVTVVNPKMNKPEGEVISPEQIQAETITPEVLEPVTVNPVTVNVDGSVTMKKPYEAPVATIAEIQEQVNEKMKELIKDEPEEEEPEPEEEEVSENTYGDPSPVEKKDIKKVILDFIDGVCESKNVFVVSMPKVTIRNNGQIFGCNKRLIADRDSDVIFEFNKKEFVKHPDELDSKFVMTIVQYFANLLKNNYVFINKKATSFRTDEYGNLTLTLYTVAKRKYFFSK